MIKKLLIKLGIIKKPKSKSPQVKCSSCQQKFELTKETYFNTYHELGIDRKCRTYYTCKDCYEKN